MSWFDELEAANNKQKETISSGVQIDVSTDGIASSCAALGMILEKIESETALLGTPKDNPTIRTSLKNNRKDAASQRDKLEQVIKLVEKKYAAPNANKEEKSKFLKAQKQVEDVLKSFKKISIKSVNKEKQLEANSVKFKSSSSDIITEVGADGSSAEAAQEQAQEQKQQQKKFVLTEAAANTIETERAIEKQKLEDLKRLQVDMNDLHSCYVDIKDMLEQQQELIDKVQDNVETAAAHVEVGVEELKAVNDMPLCIIS